MQKKYLSTKLVGMALVAMLAACGESNNDIPPAIEPEKPGTDEPVTPDRSDYNSLGEGFVAHKDGDPYNTYMGLVMTGYQGWFGTPGDGSPMTQVPNQGWYHYRENEMFRPGVLRNSIDFWPDMSEYQVKYTPGEQYPAQPSGTSTYSASPFLFSDGSYAQLFSSYDESTVMLHFKWMQQYGIDGAFMQRFVGEILSADHKDHFDTVLRHAMKASNEYKRAISVMYDMSGCSESMLGTMVSDAQKLINDYALNDRSKQKYYLYENGKPMLALWGVGFNDNAHPKPSVLMKYVEQLQAQGWSIMLGCPAYWRQGGNDCVTGAEHTALINLIKKCDAFMPWYVGRFGYDNFGNDDWQNRIKQDIEKAKTFSTKDHKVVYAVHTFPGGSDRNMHPNNGYPGGDGTNTGFRFGGKFFWKQLYCDIKNGAEAIYVGMFDEMDEGTAIFKQLHVSEVPSNIPYPFNSVPTSGDYTYANGGTDYWVTFTTKDTYGTSSSQKTGSDVRWCEKASDLNIKFQGIDDNLPTDHYLWLTGQGAKMLVGDIKMTEELPKR